MNEMKYKLLFTIHRCPKNSVSIRIREDISYSFYLGPRFEIALGKK